MLVELRPTSACDAVGVLRKAGATTVSATLRLYSLDSRSASQVLPRIRACKALRLTAPDRPAGTLSVTDFTDPLVPSEWWRAAIGVADLTPPAAGKPVTIIDSGVDVAHPEFVGWPDLVMLNAQEPQPFGGVHGTAVASLIGATENGVGIVGVYPQALVQSWDSAIGAGTQLDTSEIVKGVLAAAAGGPGVINLSLGGNSFEVVIQQAIATAISKGLLVVAAAGNDGDAGNPLTYPASLPHVLTVAATDEQNQVAVLLEPVSLRRPRGTGSGHDGRLGTRCELAAGGRHELLVAARGGCRRLGVDGAARSRREPAVRGDAPFRDGHRRTGT